MESENRQIDYALKEMFSIVKVCLIKSASNDVFSVFSACALPQSLLPYHHFYFLSFCIHAEPCANKFIEMRHFCLFSIETLKD